MKSTVSLLVLLLMGGCRAPSAVSPTDLGVGGSGPDGAAALDAAVPADAAGAADAGGAGPDMALPVPTATTPTLLLPGTALYPRAIRLAAGSAAGTIVASVVAPQASGRMGGTILASHDDGVTFAVIGHIDDALAAGGLCCATLYELPRAVGKLPAGTLLWSASVGGDAPTKPMSIPVWSSADAGKSWSLLGTVVTATVPKSSGGLWEPEFSLLDDGTLVCHYSDETDAAHSQKLVEARSSDGVAWGSYSATVAPNASGQRPGMANVRRLPSGGYLMSYEVCGVANDNCTVHLRRSADGWNWGDPNDLGMRPTTVDGMNLRHAPTLVWNDRPGANGRLYLVGQMVYDGAGNVAPENGSVILANSESGNQSWYEVAAPVPIAAPYDNFCPNYSSPLLPLDDGRFALEIATRWDGSVCRAYFARGPLLGSGDAGGLASGDKKRLVNVMSGLCLDVSGGSSAAGTKIEQWTCNDLAPQNWTFTAGAGGGFTLRAQNSGLCLAAAATQPGAAIEQQPCDGSAAQSWTVRNVGVGYYTLRHSGGACLDDSGGSSSAGNTMELWTCNDLAPQIWHLETR